MSEIRKYTVAPSASIREVIAVIDANKAGIAVVVDEAGRLRGTVTDGDIRRLLLAGKSVETPCAEVMWTEPVTATVGASEEELRAILLTHRLRNVVVVDAEGRPREVVDLRAVVPHEPRGTIAVVMAGGEGRRLRPITERIPKPMVEVGGRPILEAILENLAEHGVGRVYLAVNYRAEVIEAHFGDGDGFGLEIRYLREECKLGTAGALALLPETPESPFLLMNGDVLTRINVRALFDFHRRHRAAMTVAASEYNFRIPLGVLEIAGHHVLGVEEKPAKRFLCNAGIYALDPEMLRFVPEGRPFHTTDLLGEAVREGLPVAAFPIHEYWVDVGQKEDLERARLDHGDDTGDDEGGDGDDDGVPDRGAEPSPPGEAEGVRNDQGGRA